MRKRFTAMALAVIMAASSLIGCGSSGSSGNSEATGQTTTTSSSEESANSGVTAQGEKVKLTALFVAHPLTKDVNEMQWLQEIEDAAGVDIEWEMIYTDWETVKSTRFASGDIPDLLFNATINSDYTTYDGLFQDMTELIEANAPNVQAMFTEEPDTKILANLDGKIYGIPKFQGKWPSTNTVMFINKQWLDNLGLEKPTTFSELEEVLLAFKEQDANGNGNPNDEVPLDYNAYGGNNWWFNSAYSLTNLLGGLGIQLTNWGTDGYFAEYSTVKNYAVDERYKLFIKYLNQLYSKGLINENALTNDYSAFQSLSRGDENGNAMVGVVFGWEETDKFGPTLYEQYEPLAALDYDIDCAAGTYDTRWRDDYTGLNMSENRVCMSANASDKEAAMRFIDQFYDADVSVQTLFGGITDGCVAKTGDNSFKVLDPLDPDTDAGTWKWTNAFADNGPMYIRRSSEIEMAQDMTYALEEREYYNDTIAKADVSDTYPQMFMKYTAEEQNIMAVNQANINNIIDNYWALWMTGESDIDADWDNYVQQVYGAGLQEILDIRQAAFDVYLSQQ